MTAAADLHPDLDNARDLLPAVIDAVREAGRRLLERFRTSTDLLTGDAVAASIHAHDAVSTSALRPVLQRVRPGAGWVDDELDDGPLPAGEWWVTDPVEGAISYVHGMAEWAVTARLVRDNLPVLTVVHLPVAETTYTAERGHGAFQDGQRLRTSRKTDVAAALTGTGQASPRETGETFSLIGRSVTAMLEAGLVIRASVPATLQLVHVAAGRMEAFWQYSAVRSGLATVAEALDGADVVVSGLGTTRGSPPGVLTAGAKAVVHAAPARIVRLGAFGTGPSGPAAGALTRAILAIALRSGISDKTAADALVLAAGATVLHAGPLTNRPLTPYRTHGIDDVPRRVVVAPVSRAVVAAAMLDEAETGLHPGQVLIPMATSRPAKAGARR